MTIENREDTLEEHDIESNPDIAKKMEWMRERMGLETNEELLSKALSLLHQTIELEDQGYTVGAWKDSMFSRHVVKYRIASKK
ncbi:hypothetical protein [Paenibacillus gansuensis]|uniref:Uncharacterized protein n=1 Tax=Paenibacillus gansuensis TaxID=306542 RepID=A0ABW5PGR5_9BACL